jgi:pimeloyl-ACP methyl ester carboxylesterase
VPLIDGPEGALEVLVTGRGDPVTVFAHGLASSVDETRPFGSGVRGSRVFFHFRGHGATFAPPTPWTYAGLQADLMSVVSRYDARRALGVSLGAGAVLGAAWAAPDVFERLVFVLPSTIDLPRHDVAVRRMEQTAELVDRHDLEALAAALVADQPAGVRGRPDVRVWAGRQARRLAGTSVARALRELPSQHPLPAGADLSRISCPVLVLGQEDDAAHPARLARELADRLPDGRVRVFDGDGLLWGHRAEVREVVSSFLNSAG